MHDDRTAQPGATAADHFDLRDGLVAWAETVCEAAEIKLDPRAAWALEVTDRRAGG